MPKAYEDLKHKFIRMGTSEREAKSRAAAIFNGVIAPKTHQPFVTGNAEKGKGGKK